MRSKAAVILVALAAVAIPAVIWWNKRDAVRYVDLNTLPQWLRNFDATSQDRSDAHHSTTVMFENLSYYVSTQEKRKVDGYRWRYVSFGPSRESGYFVCPRMAWAETIDEVEAIIREDYRRGIGISTAHLAD